MKVLVVGGGGREHALIKKIKESSKVDEIYCAQMCIRDSSGSTRSKP